MKVVLRLFAAGILFLLAVSCHVEEELPKIALSAQKLSDGIAVLKWNNVEYNNGFNVWRIVEQDGKTSPPKLLASVDSLTIEFIDDNIPLSTGLTYYVTTSWHDDEMESNAVELDGAAVFNILPYQMKLLPEKKLAIVRGYDDISLIDYEEKIIVKRRQFPGKVGTIDMSSFEGKKELYVPCSDNNVYICSPIDLTIVDTLKTSSPVGAVAVTSNGNIYTSSSAVSLPLKLYRRSTLSLVYEYPGESDSHILLQSDGRLLAMSSHIFPPIMSFYTMTASGGLLSKADDPYYYEYEMEGERLKVSNQYVVTSYKGVVYAANDNMAYVTTLASAGTNQIDFEFSQDGKSIFSATTDHRLLYKFTISGNQVSTTFISTKGYPWILARNGNEMIILSSPDPFAINFFTSNIIIERVILN